MRGGGGVVTRGCARGEEARSELVRQGGWLRRRVLTFPAVWAVAEPAWLRVLIRGLGVMAVGVIAVIH